MSNSSKVTCHPYTQTFFLTQHTVTLYRRLLMSVTFWRNTHSQHTPLFFPGDTLREGQVVKFCFLEEATLDLFLFLSNRWSNGLRGEDEEEKECFNAGYDAFWGGFYFLKSFAFTHSCTNLVIRTYIYSFTSVTSIYSEIKMSLNQKKSVKQQIQLVLTM